MSCGASPAVSAKPPDAVASTLNYPCRNILYIVREAADGKRVATLRVGSGVFLRFVRVKMLFQRVTLLVWQTKVSVSIGKVASISSLLGAGAGPPMAWHLHSVAQAGECPAKAIEHTGRAHHHGEMA